MKETQASLRESLRQLPRGAYILFLGTFLNKFGSFVLPFLAIYMLQLGFTTAQAGIAIGAYGVGTLCASLLGGYLADSFGRRKTIVLSMFSVAGAMLCLSQAKSLTSIVTFSALCGLTGELYRPASSALLADLVPPGQRVTAFAGYRLALNAGWAFGPAAGGFMTGHSFVWLFIGDAITSALFGLVAWFALPHGQRAQASESRWAEAAQTMLKDRQFQRVLLASVPIAFVFFQMSST